MSFDRSQQSYYVREINRAVAVPGAQSSINPSSLSASFGEPDGGVVHIDSIVSDNANLANLQHRDSACRALPYPGPGMRDPAARSGCGWWFVPDPSRPSIAAYGTRRGPMSPTLDTSIGPGKWMWDPRDAQRMEGMKQTANIVACPDIQFAKFPNVGWCPTTNMAILTDGAGNPLFPTMPGGDCPGSSIVMNAASCPPPPPPNSETFNGGPAPSLSPSITQLCTPGAGGALSPQCLSSLIGPAGCSTNISGANAATLAVALSNGYAGTSQNFNNTNAFLAARGFQINAGIINDGKVSMGDALNSMQGIRQLANSGDGSSASAAAANLCYGKPFDPCAISPAQTRSSQPSNTWASMADCIYQAAIDRGYAPNAGLMPGKIGIAYWDQMNTWQDVLNNLDWWMAQAHNQSNPVAQAGAIENVYGLNLNFPAQTCPIPPVGV